MYSGMPKSELHSWVLRRFTFGPVPDSLVFGQRHKTDFKHLVFGQIFVSENGT